MTDSEVAPSLKDPRTRVAEKLSHVKNKVAVLSGKGGVGKSTVAANVALALAERFKDKIGLIDADIHGPNIPKILGIEDKRPAVGPTLVTPVLGPKNLHVVSMAFFLESKDTPVIWRGPLKMKVIEQFLADFFWGELEWLVVDLPPGTGDETLSIVQLIPNMTGAIIVTTPQEVSTLDTGKALSMMKHMNIPVLGVVENMSSFVCPNCGISHPIFGDGGGKKLAQRFGVPLLAQIPFVPEIRLKEDAGISEAFKPFFKIAEALIKEY
ncbi:MAG: Mrp/NBP35 family ATP-binding protein [Candidatus Hodarchaeota archaeon]